MFLFQNTRLHPQGKGGPQVILCGRCLKMCQKSENVPTERIKKSSISTDRPFTTRGLLIKKCVFERFLAARRRYVFAKLTGPLISTDRGCLDYATQKMCTGCCCTVAKRRKIRRRRRRRTYLRTHVFKRRPHKMPFGQRYRQSLIPRG